MSNRQSLTALPLALAILGAPGCRGQEPPPAPKGLLATVNGRPLVEADLVQRLQRESNQSVLRPEHKKNLLEATIAEEIAAQEAVALGLDRDPKYQEELEERQAQLRAFQRQRLAELHFQREIAGKAEVSEAEARQHFEKSASRLRVELHIQQILRRGRGAIDEAAAALKEGRAFEEVAASDFQDIPPGQKPWDLGFLKWPQLPAPWREALAAMKPGEVSPVIEGPKERYWIVKLVEARDAPGATFEALRPVLVESLKGEKVEERRRRIEGELRERATIVYRD